MYLIKLTYIDKDSKEKYLVENYPSREIRLGVKDMIEMLEDIVIVNVKNGFPYDSVDTAEVYDLELFRKMVFKFVPDDSNTPCKKMVIPIDVK